MTLDGFLNFAIASVGSFILQAFFIAQGRPIVSFVRPLTGKWNKPSAKLANAIAFSLVGGLVGYLVFEPTSPRQAILAGLAWFGFVGALPSLSRGIGARELSVKGHGDERRKEG